MTDLGKYCKNCGNPLSENDKFCRVCGEEIKYPHETAPETKDVSYYKPSNKYLLSIGVFLLFGFLAFISYLTDPYETQNMGSALLIFFFIGAVFAAPTLALELGARYYFKNNRPELLEKPLDYFAFRNLETGNFSKTKIISWIVFIAFGMMAFLMHLISPATYFSPFVGAMLFLIVGFMFSIPTFALGSLISYLTR